MAINDAFHKSTDTLSNGDDFIVDGSSTNDTGAAEVFEFGGDVDVEVYKETDPDGDTTYEVSVLIDAFAAPFHSQKNEIVVSQTNNHRIRFHVVDADATGNGEVYATGMEVNDKQ